MVVYRQRKRPNMGSIVLLSELPVRWHGQDVGQWKNFCYSSLWEVSTTLACMSIKAAFSLLRSMRVRCTGLNVIYAAEGLQRV